MPLNAPAALGVNLTLSVALCPAAIRTGRLGAVSEKYLVERAAPLMVIGAFPEFVAATVTVLLLPTATLPKLREVDASERVLVCC